jgi:hypothetical protein
MNAHTATKLSMYTGSSLSGHFRELSQPAPVFPLINSHFWYVVFIYGRNEVRAHTRTYEMRLSTFFAVRFGRSENSVFIAVASSVYPLPFISLPLMKSGWREMRRSRT